LAIEQKEKVMLEGILGRGGGEAHAKSLGRGRDVDVPPCGQGLWTSLTDDEAQGWSDLAELVRSHPRFKPQSQGSAHCLLVSAKVLPGPSAGEQAPPGLWALESCFPPSPCHRVGRGWLRALARKQRDWVALPLSYPLFSRVPPSRCPEQATQPDLPSFPSPWPSS
jgi:hypothetical protein